MRHLFEGERIFPNDPTYKSTGLVGKSEIVSLGCRCIKIKNCYDGYDDGTIFYQFEDGTLASGGITRFSQKNGLYIDNSVITKEQAVTITQKAMKTLRKNEQLIFYEECNDGNVADRSPFVFCGFELEHTYEGGSPLLDIDYPFNLDKAVTDKLNDYGLFGKFEDILWYKNKVDEADTVENNGDRTDYYSQICNISAVPFVSTPTRRKKRHISAYPSRLP